MNQLQHIQITELHHHPNNPRLDLGDLTELSESIKARGVMQNLTVVPRYRDMTSEEYARVCKEYRENPTEEGQRIINQHQVFDGYNVVIGNRRMEAAKLAGLESLPCIVAEMSEKEQMSTMLLENMQRSDLSIYEQAQGFQMMMDLGMTTEEISAKTGFSDSTVRRRVKLCQYDKNQFKAACERGATLLDWAEVEKIENPKRREKVIAALGTSNFKWQLSTAIGEERDEKWRKEVLPQITPWATKLKLEKGESTWKNYETKANYWSGNPKAVVVPDDKDSVEYFYEATKGSITIYVRREDEVDEEQAAAEKIEQERQLARKEVRGMAYQLRKDFVMKYTGSKKDHARLIDGFAKMAIIGGYCWFRENIFRELCGIPKPENGRVGILPEEIADIPNEKLLLAWCVSGGLIVDDVENGFLGWRGAYEENPKLQALYDLLQALGYEMSDEEKQLQDGTHPLFVVNEDDDDVCEEEE